MKREFEMRSPWDGSPKQNLRRLPAFHLYKKYLFLKILLLGGDHLEVFKLVGASFGYVLSAIALITLFINGAKGKLGGFVKRESKSDSQNERLEKLENLLENYIKEDGAFKEQVLDMLHIQKKASRQSLAHIIEETYYKNKDAGQLDRIELKRVINAYDVYHNRCEGNSYITEIYEEMMDWVRL